MEEKKIICQRPLCWTRFNGRGRGCGGVGGDRLNVVWRHMRGRWSFLLWKYSQVIRAVDWLRESVTLLQVKAQIVRIDFRVGLCGQAHQFPEQYSKWPLKTNVVVCKRLDQFKFTNKNSVNCIHCIAFQTHRVII